MIDNYSQKYESLSNLSGFSAEELAVENKIFSRNNPN